MDRKCEFRQKSKTEIEVVDDNAIVATLTLTRPDTGVLDLDFPKDGLHVAFERVTLGGFRFLLPRA